jgi:hypothetical protein
MFFFDAISLLKLNTTDCATFNCVFMLLQIELKTLNIKHKM